MADLQEQLQAILGNPEAMGQITAIARALTGGGPDPSGPAPVEEPSSPFNHSGAVSPPETAEPFFSPTTEPPPASGMEYIPVETPSAPPPAPPQESPAPPGGMPGLDFSTLFGMMGNMGNMGNMGGMSETSAGLPGINPRLIQIALRVYAEYSAQDDEKTALLQALRPFLREERREKLEKAARIARLSRVVRVAIQLLREEGDSHV